MSLGVRSAEEFWGHVINHQGEWIKKMADASTYVYKTRGRGRGILGLTEYIPCRRPGCVEKSHTAVNNSTDTPGAALIYLSYIAT